jgi:sucrose-phosphate synthase
MESIAKTAGAGGPGLYIALISVHGRIRGRDLELGSEPDTGGQTLYVVELARALARRSEVSLVELFTRRIVDPELSPDYAVPIEELGPGARIVRIEAGPEKHLRKEEVWDHLDSFADNMLAYLRVQERRPDVVHAHYADAGYVGVRVANPCGCPLVFTGHSLGRIKRRCLLADGKRQEEIEARYHISRRIEAEEATLAAASLVVTSTSQEVREQYAIYDDYHPSHMRVLPPGLDLERFHPEDDRREAQHVEREIARFLRRPGLPMVLAIARPDERKNLVGLIRAFGTHERLREAANLVIVAGNRDDVREQEAGVRGVITNMLLAIDAYDIYGQVAVPKHHRREDVPLYYRVAARTGGVFINPALTEPFGLTLLEAAGCGLPIVATEDGGPTEILSRCHNGRLIDPLDSKGIAEAILEVISDPEQWKGFAEQGVRGVREHYSWDAHAAGYLRALEELPSREAVLRPVKDQVRRHLYNDRAVFTDIDQNLLGSPETIDKLGQVMRRNRAGVAFGIATRRSLKGALQFLRHFDLPKPDVLITGLGIKINYLPKLVPDIDWQEHINHQWNPQGILRLLTGIPGLTYQRPREQDYFKISYLVDPSVAPDHAEIVRWFRNHGITANTYFSFGRYLDIVPLRASKGAAIRHVAENWDIPVERILAAGGSGVDEDMMRGNTLAVVVANRHEEELSQLIDVDRIYFSKRPFAEGILEAIEHYDFFGRCAVPEEPEETEEAEGAEK